MDRFRILRRLLKYSIWFGLGLTIAGISAGLVSGSWSLIPTGLIIAGVVLMGIWLLFLGQLGDSEQPNFWQRRSTQVGTNVLVSTLAVLVILGLLNFVAAKTDQRLDLTETQLFTLAPETQSVLKKLDQPLTVYVFDRQPHPQDRDLLQNFRRINSNFSFEFVDPDANPGLAQRFNLKNDANNRDVYIEVPRTHRQQFVQSVSNQQRLSESRLVNGILQATGDREIKVYFTQGHGERSLNSGEASLSDAVKELQGKNIESLPLNLAQEGKIPDDAAAIVIAGATRPLFEPEVKLLEDYLNKGGNLMVMVDPEAKPGLDDLLKSWGIALDNRVAIDASGAGQMMNFGPAAPVVQDYSQHPITKDFRNGISVYPLARPLEIKTVPGVAANPIVLTSQQSWAESNLKESPLKQDADDRPGPLPLGVALSRAVPPNPTPSPSPQASPSPAASPDSKAGAAKKESRLVVFGNSSFASDPYFGVQLNGDVFLNSVSWLSQEKGQTLSIRPREMKNRRINLTMLQELWSVSLAVVILPLAAMAGAVFLWWRRR